MESFSELTALAPRVVKVAVMPQSKQDVLDLMNYTRGFKTLNPEQEYATMSMGNLDAFFTFFAVDVLALRGHSLVWIKQVRLDRLLLQI